MYIIIRFLAFIFMIFGILTALGLIGIPFMILGRDMKDYADRLEYKTKLKWALSMRGQYHGAILQNSKLR